jgi:hypothetical protein
MSTGSGKAVWPNHFRAEQFGAIRDKREDRNGDGFLKFEKPLVKKGRALSVSPGVVT